MFWIDRNRTCSLLGVSPSPSASQMLMQAKQEVPSLELGPPSPSWMDQLAGSPPGEIKPAACHEAPRSLGSEVCGPIRIQLVSSNLSVTCDSRKSSQTSHHRSVAVRSASSASYEASAILAGATSCESRKRTTSPSESSSKRYAKKRRVVPSGEETTTTDLEKWSTALSADALSETFLAPSAMDMERDATEEFMNEFWGDLMLETSPPSNDNLIAAASSFDEPQSALPTAEPDSHLLDGVTEDQLLELAQFLEPGHPEVLAPAPAEVPPPPQQPLAPATTECAVSAPIDLAALLEETEIVFSPELMPATEPAAVTQTASLLPTTPPPPPAPATAAEPTHYLLVLSSPEQEPTPAASSVTSDSTDDPEFALDDTTRSWSASTEAETEEEVFEVARTAGTSRKRASRRPPATTPAEKYRRIRDTNNEASRRSRQQRKQREVDTQTRADELEEENARLRQKAEVLESLLEQVKALAPLLTAKR